ncbi:hypothetical protein [Alphaentomopoxvirus acuprea]|uniref:Uncharacterized protein n=1 Tax=Alphaentomopoxvirus acuprea TaxID=62099 RepID=W6JL27_9POXV|nr:hypothetical protein BA82_gp175 [Anomala cuprea entomopoxvirus]BAO49535.1 hypothetical protein [Anomala cuprea entomopoxvirus]
MHELIYKIIKSNKQNISDSYYKIFENKKIEDIKFCIIVRTMDELNNIKHTYLSDNNNNILILPLYIDNINHNICELIVYDIIKTISDNIIIYFNIDTPIKLDNELIDNKNILYIKFDNTINNDLNKTFELFKLCSYFYYKNPHIFY